MRKVCRAVGGGTPSRNQPKFWNGEIPWASVKDFTDESVFLANTTEHITREGLECGTCSLVAESTPVVCTRMAVGRCALTIRPTAINQDLKAIFLNDGLDPRSFIRLLRYRGAQLERLGIGSTVRGISTKDLLNLHVRYPELPEQRRIAAVLDAANEAIAKTEAVIAKRKQVRAGLLHDPIAHPEQFQDSSLGRIPRGWETRSIRQLTGYISYGFTNPMPTTADGPWMLTAFDIGDGVIKYDQARHTSQDAFDSLLTGKSKPGVGDVPVTKDGTLGRVAVVGREGVCINQSVAVLCSLPSTDTDYMVLFLRSPAGQSAMLSEAGGSSIKHISMSLSSPNGVLCGGTARRRIVARGWRPVRTS